MIDENADLTADDVRRLAGYLHIEVTRLFLLDFPSHITAENGASRWPAGDVRRWIASYLTGRQLVEDVALFSPLKPRSPLELLYGGRDTPEEIERTARTLMGCARMP